MKTYVDFCAVVFLLSGLCFIPAFIVLDIFASIYCGEFELTFTTVYLVECADNASLMRYYE